MSKAWRLLWSNRTMTLSVAQIMVANLAAAELVQGFWLKFTLYVNGTLTGLIALHNKLKEVRAAEQAKAKRAATE